MTHIKQSTIIWYILLHLSDMSFKTSEQAPEPILFHLILHWPCKLHGIYIRAYITRVYTYTGSSKNCTPFVTLL